MILKEVFGNRTFRNGFVPKMEKYESNIGGI